MTGRQFFTGYYRAFWLEVDTWWKDYKSESTVMIEVTSRIAFVLAGIFRDSKRCRRCWNLLVMRILRGCSPWSEKPPVKAASAG